MNAAAHSSRWLVLNGFLDRRMVAEVGLLFDHRGHVIGHHAFPAGITAANPSQDVPREDTEAFRVVVVEADDVTAVPQVLVKFGEVVVDVQVFTGDELLAVPVFHWVTEDPQVVLEQSTKRFQNATLQPGVVLLFK